MTLIDANMVSVRLVLLILLLGGTLPCLAQDGGPCPNPKKLSSLCIEIKTHSEADNPFGNHKYDYHRTLMEASCVTETDTEEVRVAKVRLMWQQLGKQHHCTDNVFEVPRGNVVKYGIAMNFDRFIRDLTRLGLDLNQVDDSDGQTALDYVKTTQARYQGTSVEPKLQMFYDQLRKAGAKHRSEL